MSDEVTTREACEARGWTRRQVGYWTTIGLVTPVYEAPGRPSRFLLSDLEKAARQAHINQHDKLRRGTPGYSSSSRKQCAATPRVKELRLTPRATAGGGRGNVPYHKTPTLRDELFELRRLMKGLR